MHVNWWKPVWLGGFSDQTCDLVGSTGQLMVVSKATYIFLFFFNFPFFLFYFFTILHHLYEIVNEGRYYFHEFKKIINNY